MCSFIVQVSAVNTQSLAWPRMADAIEWGRENGAILVGSVLIVGVLIVYAYITIKGLVSKMPPS